jgi:hypothetical protein
VADIIDAFMVTLGLDSSGYSVGQAKAKKATRDLEDQVVRSAKEREAQERKLAGEEKRRQHEADDRAKQSVENFKHVRNSVLSLAAIFTAGVGIKDFISNTIDNAASLGYLSANLSMTTEQLSAWQHASERAGGTAAGLTAQFKESAETLAALKSGLGPSEGLQWFFRMGGSSDDLKDGNTYLLARSKIIADLFKSDPSRAALVAKQMGISEDQFNFIKQGPAAILTLVAAQEKNNAITAKGAAAALDLKNKWLDLTQSLEAQGIRVLTSLMPTITKLLTWVESLTDKFTVNKELIDEWSDKLINADWSQITNGVKEFAHDIHALTQDIKELTDRWDEWTGHSKVQTPGVTKLPGAVRIGKTDDLNADNRATGKPVPASSRPKNETLATISDAIEIGLARTLASFGVKSAGEFIRDTTGHDDYDVGPKTDPVQTQTAMSKLMKMGWTPAQASGITGSFMQESNLNPAATNPKSGAYGIGQWLGPRVADFKAWSGHDLKGSSLDEQLEFFQYEVTKGKEKAAGDKLRAAKTTAEAAKIHSDAYERPGVGEANIARRQALGATLDASQRAQNAAAAAGMPAGAAASAPAVNTVSKSSTTTSETKIDTINIHTQATDANGIAKDLRPAVEKYTFATQANTGMTP